MLVFWTSCWFFPIFNQLLTARQHVPPKIPLSGCGEVVKTDFNAQPKLWGSAKVPVPATPPRPMPSLSFTTFCQSLIFMFIAQILALLHTRSVNFQNRKMERQLLGGGVRFRE